MKYFFIAGEASGDLHAAQVMRELRANDDQAQFRFLGGDEMSHQASSAPVVHYREMAYMGFADVIRHLGSIMHTMRKAKEAIKEFNPDAIILVDYPSFNLKIAKFAHSLNIPCYYFIAPKVWVWKEWRVKSIRKYVRKIFSILPFEEPWFKSRGCEVEYVGNPSVAEINSAKEKFVSKEEFCLKHELHPGKPIVAIIPGSRKREIFDNLPFMLEAVRRFDCIPLVATAPSVDMEIYRKAMGNNTAKLVEGDTMQLMHHAHAALVTSGTATLETALLGTPQVACYRFTGSKFSYWMYSKLLHGKYVTLPNLIVDKPVIAELLMHFCNADSISKHLAPLLSASPERQAMLSGYAEMRRTLGINDCALNTATAIIKDLK